MFKRLRDTKGAIAILTVILLTTLVGFVALGTETGHIYTVRNQLQNAADSAAMAGAAYLYLPDRTDAINKATKEAIKYALKNKASNKPVVLSTSDIEFSPAAPENPLRIKVTVRRTKATGNPVQTLFASVLPGGISSVDVTATSTAALMSVKAVGGLRPWAVRDKWVDVNGDEIVDEGEYVGYTDADLGRQVILKYGMDDGRTMPQWFNPVDLPPLNRDTPITGADAYRDLIENGYNEVIMIGDQLQIETGNMIGPTEDGITHLINDDPYSYWDGTNVVNSSYADMKSPRIIKIAFYDPTELPSSGMSDYITVIKFGAFFVEGINVSGDGPASNNIMGRFIKIITDDEPGDAFPSFLTTVSLVK
ncbi:MAG: pilus assembly protein TadG-related protein [Candidatus Brocadiales bacterium]